MSSLFAGVGPGGNGGVGGSGSGDPLVQYVGAGMVWLGNEYGCNGG